MSSTKLCASCTLMIITGRQNTYDLQPAID
jgi:hypothetical protein